MKYNKIQPIEGVLTPISPHPLNTPLCTMYIIDYKVGLMHSTFILSANIFFLKGLLVHRLSNIGLYTYQYRQSCGTVHTNVQHTYFFLFNLSCKPIVILLQSYKK